LAYPENFESVHGGVVLGSLRRRRLAEELAVAHFQAHPEVDVTVRAVREPGKVKKIIIGLVVLSRKIKGLFR
jgi:hypothetical protein